MEDNNYVVKANKFIEAKGRLGVIEQKLLGTLISEIRPEDKDFQEYKFNIQEVGEFIGLNNNAVYERLSEASYNLLDKKLKFDEIDDEGKKTFIAVSLIASARHKEGSGILTMTIAPDLKPYLLAINGKNTPFTKYMIKNILKLSGTYSIRLYELLKQYEKVKKRTFEIAELKELLGAEAESYKLFSEFERRVLSPAKNEINKHTDVFINYKKIKTGRRISHIEFEIETSYGHYDLEEEEHKLNEKEKLFDYEFIKVNSGMGEEKLSRTQIFDIYTLAIKRTKSYGVDELAYIELNYKYAKERAKTGLYNYISLAVDNDYAKAILKLAQIEM